MEAAPALVRSGLDQNGAEEVQELLEATGATVEVSLSRDISKGGGVVMTILD